MNEEIIKSWNEMVKLDDIVYHLCDFLCNPKDKLTSIFNRLNGYKVLIMGIYDYRSGYNYYKSLDLMGYIYKN